jgi:hypothetical protein
MECALILVLNEVQKGARAMKRTYDVAAETALGLCNGYGYLEAVKKVFVEGEYLTRIKINEVKNSMANK